MREIIGLAVLSWPLVLLSVIGLAFVVAIPLAVRYAKRTGSSKWRWGIAAFLLVFLPIFWDWIPTVAVHQYYCAKESGFWVYKTLDQWKAENPGVMETLVANKVAPQTQERFDDGHGVTDTYLLNDRFNWIIIKQDISSLLPIMRFEQQVKDVKKNEVLARYVDFATGNSIKNTVGPPGPLKFWLHSGHCIGGEMNDSKLAHFFIAAKNINEKGTSK